MLFQAQEFLEDDCQGNRAAMITNGRTNSKVFEGFVNWPLAPTLRPGDILVMNNLLSHKSTNAIEMIERTGTVVRFFPPYSPDLNQIEQIFSKLKTYLRCAAATSERRLYFVIAEAIKTITKEDCLNGFRNSGYVGT